MGQRARARLDHDGLAHLETFFFLFINGVEHPVFDDATGAKAYCEGGIENRGAECIGISRLVRLLSL
jgi:hypothetical protein